MDGEKPLDQIKVLITRGKEGAKELSSLIEGNGGTPVSVPLLDFKPYDDPLEGSFIASIHNYEWIIFTSKNSVAFFLEKLTVHNINASSLSVSIAAVGTKTEKYCEMLGLSVTFVPDDFTGDDLVRQFITERKPSGKVLVPKGNLARNVIAVELKEAGIHCDEWIIYETILPGESFEKLKVIIEAGGVDILTFTSSSTVRHFMRVVEGDSLYAKIRHLPAACIGPLTKKTAEECGLHVKICPNTYTVDEMVTEIIQYVSEAGDKS
ncbi:uroporphyrinogen-III synthase [Bacillus haikouensis]|uniref:uroporphyrinogen-III synthase n=1 Tax=Bacillus haikouensis TaxID=1510468 RepID=UPI001556454F|nr:uroporphyrinogen-III synthase [Bacillus haikouensis]NQD65353.1 uroporphyrinogen-III synthase [Bacillus haikouensis]